jgi:hypothetical protein
MQLAGDRTHVHPIIRNMRSGLCRIGAISVRARDNRKRERIKERGETIRIEELNRARQKGHRVGEGTGAKNACGSNHGLAEKSAAGCQLKNLHCG